MKKTLGLIGILLLIIVGEGVWLSQMDLQGIWEKRISDSIQQQGGMPYERPDFSSDDEETGDLWGTMPANSSPVATLGDATGEVMVVRDHEELSITPFMPLQDGDMIETGADGNAEIAWTGYGRTIIAPNTKLTITQASYGAADAGVLAKLKLEAGRVWTRLEKLLTSGSSFEVKASNVVATVRGTSFGVGMSDAGQIEVKVAEHNVEVGRTASADSDEIIGTPITVGAMQRMEMAEKDTSLPKPVSMSSKEMEADLFLMEGNRVVPEEYLDLEWMSFVEMILNSIPADQFPADFNREEFMEYMRQVQNEIPEEVKQQYMQEYQSGMYNN